MTGDPNILLGGETLRYTITVKNVGTVQRCECRAARRCTREYDLRGRQHEVERRGGCGRRRPVPAGERHADPLAGGHDTGSMPADAPSNPANVATITFDVVVDTSVTNGTVISNQGFVTANGSGIVDHPSDDPDTPTADDPTRDIVGNLPLLYAEKRVALFGDLGSPGRRSGRRAALHDHRTESGASPATGVICATPYLRIPPTSRIRRCSTDHRLVGQDGGVSPLASGINAGNLARSDCSSPVRSARQRRHAAAGHCVSATRPLLTAPNCRMSRPMATAIRQRPRNQRLSWWVPAPSSPH